MIAAVFFGHRAEHLFACWLAPGFRHCDIAVQHPAGPWLGIVGGSGGIQVWPLREGFDPAAFAEQNRMTVIRTRTRRHCHYRLLGRVDCVGVVKAVLGLRAWWVLTPWQLHRHLLREAA